MRAASVAVACIAVMLTACVQPDQSVRQDRKGVDFAPDAQGLAVTPGNQRIDFGRSPKGMVPAMTRELGKPSVLSLAGCPAEISQRLRWDDLEVTFTRERFVGWRKGDAQQGRVCV